MIDNTEKIMAAITRASARAYTRLGMETAAEIKRSMKSGGAGKPGRRPRSAPGMPPNVQYGILRGSIDYEVVKLGGASVAVRVGTNKVYGRHLELGTSRMLPRPYIKPGIKGKQRRAQELLAEELGKAVGK